MASGQQLAARNADLFNTWAASKTDTDFRQLVRRGILNRAEIAKECGFAKSALDQNPKIKVALRDLEDQLRARGVLPKPVSAEDAVTTGESAQAEATDPQREPSQKRAAFEAERRRRLEQEVASLQAENAELKKQLAKFTLLSDALANAGRLPR